MIIRSSRPNQTHTTQFRPSHWKQILPNDAGKEKPHMKANIQSAMSWKDLWEINFHKL